MNRSILQRHLEEAESRIQRSQRNVDHQREAVSTLERDGQDVTIAQALLRLFERALAVHVAGTGSSKSWRILRPSKPT
jgi:hypothetical protein